MARLILLALLLAPVGTAHAQTWSQLPSPSGYPLYSCWFDAADPNHGVVTGYYIQAFDLIPFEYTTFTGGATWSYTNLYYSSSFLAARGSAFTSSTTGYIVGGGVVKTLDGGATWDLTTDVFTIGGQLYDVTFPSTTHGYAVGESWIGPSPMLCTTVNSGGTWTCTTVSDPVHAVASQLTSLARPSESALYAGASGGGGDRTFVRSTDDGLTWTATNLTVNVLALSFTSPTTGCAGTETGILRTTNSGSTWTPVLTTTAAINGLQLAPGLGLAVAADGSIYSSPDDGVSWVPMTSPVQGTAVLNDVFIVSPALAFAVGSGGTVLTYTGPDLAIFGDGFESGDTSAWTATVP